MNPIQAVLQRFLDLAAQIVRQLLAGFLGAPVRALSGPGEAAPALGALEIFQVEADAVIDVRHAVLRPGRPRDTAHFSGDDARDTRHWVARHDGRAIGVVSVMRAPEPEGAAPAQWQLRGMAVLDDWQGEGVGARLLEAVHADVAEPMWCNARLRAVPFYERCGWTVVSEAFEIEPIGPHHRMVHRP